MRTRPPGQWALRRPPFFLDTIDACPASPMLGDPITEASYEAEIKLVRITGQEPGAQHVLLGAREHVR